jgi:competence protein ComEA
LPGESIRDRLATLSRAELIALIAVLGVTIASAGFWYLRSLPAQVQVRASSEATVPGPTTSASPTPVILVDVAGWVRRPGVYEFVEGARVIDAIDAAGGARPGAVLASLNLAAPLVDGTQVLVPKESQSPPPAGTGTGTETGSGGTGVVNVNTATNAELETLPGIGEVIAQAIVDHRIENGPFTSVDQLVDVTGIGDATLENIRELVTV